ncbi:MAG TPA: SRPBCC domain-containing protein [Thermoanaerobaculia bacterium]|nr:SRPBCC domain-containing protein [Thermoanaerobaculia bacterium]
MRLLVMIIALLLAPVAGLAGSEDSLMQGKQRTGREIVFEAVLDAPPETVYELWTTPEGVRSFLAPEARIDPVVGGRYEILFSPGTDPEGEQAGTKGARILKMDKGRALAFEWRGAGHMKEMNATPLPTWVELSFEPVQGEPGKTRLRFAHLGFGQGGGWDEAYSFFQSAWGGALDSLKKVCAERGKAPAPGG